MEKEVFVDGTKMKHACRMLIVDKTLNYSLRLNRKLFESLRSKSQEDEVSK